MAYHAIANVIPRRGPLRLTFDMVVISVTNNYWAAGSNIQTTEAFLIISCRLFIASFIVPKSSGALTRHRNDQTSARNISHTMAKIKQYCRATRVTANTNRAMDTDSCLKDVVKRQIDTLCQLLETDRFYATAHLLDTAHMLHLSTISVILQRAIQDGNAPLVRQILDMGGIKQCQWALSMAGASKHNEKIMVLLLEYIERPISKEHAVQWAEPLLTALERSIENKSHSLTAALIPPYLDCLRSRSTQEQTGARQLLNSLDARVYERCSREAFRDLLALGVHNRAMIRASRKTRGYMNPIRE